MLMHCVEQRLVDEVTHRFGLLEDGRFMEEVAHEKTDSAHKGPDEKGNPPSPIEQNLRREIEFEFKNVERDEKKSQRNPEIGPTPHISTLLGRRRFAEEDHGTGEFSPDAKSLKAVDRSQKNTRGDSNLFVGRQAGHEENGDRHEENRFDEGIFSAQRIADISEHNPPNGTSQRPTRVEHEEERAGCIGEKEL